MIDFEGRAMNTTQLTFMVLHHNKQVPDDAINPGSDTRDRVVVATAECEIGTGNITTTIGVSSASADAGCTADFSIEFTALESFSVVLVHEHTEASLDSSDDLGTYGAIEFAYRERQSSEAWSPAWLVLGAVAAVGLLVFQKKEDNSQKEEE